jgi:hypothetical protein
MAPLICAYIFLLLGLGRSPSVETVPVRLGRSPSADSVVFGSAPAALPGKEFGKCLLEVYALVSLEVEAPAGGSRETQGSLATQVVVN